MGLRDLRLRDTFGVRPEEFHELIEEDRKRGSMADDYRITNRDGVPEVEVIFKGSAKMKKRDRYLRDRGLIDKTQKGS